MTVGTNETMPPETFEEVRARFLVAVDRLAAEERDLALELRRALRGRAASPERSRGERVLLARDEARPCLQRVVRARGEAESLRAAMVRRFEEEVSRE